MSSYRVISSDSHVNEPADLWTSRAAPKFRDRVPHVESLETGDVWFYDGTRGDPAGNSVTVGIRFEAPEKMGTRIPRIDETRPGGYIPEEHVKDLDLDGIDMAIIYPTTGVRVYAVPASDILTYSCTLYNDWISEFCSAAPKRLKAIAMLNVDDVGDGVKEMERCAKLGFIGAMIAVYPLLGRSYDRPEYEPLWAAAQDLEMPISLHAATNRPGEGQEFLDMNTVRPSSVSLLAHWAAMSLGDIICSGAFERYPNLSVGSVEHELSWVPHFLDRMDYNYTQRSKRFSPYRYQGDIFPSDFFRSNCFLGFQEDSLGIRLRDLIGVDTLQWGSDYPHPESTFPRSREILEEILSTCTEEEKAKIVGGNSARIYRLD